MKKEKLRGKEGDATGLCELEPCTGRREADGHAFEVAVVRWSECGWFLQGKSR